MKKKKIKKKEKNFLREKYNDSFKLFIESKAFFFYGIFLFGISIALGAMFPQIFQEQIIAMIREMIAHLEGKTAFELSYLIFFNNVQASFYGLILGMFLGIFPVMISLFNGYIIGFTSRLAVSQEGIFVLWRLLPHGIFELPAIILSVGIGIRLGAKYLEENFNVHKKINQILVISLVTIVFSLIFLYVYTNTGEFREQDEFNFQNVSPFTLILLGSFNILFLIFLFYVSYSFIRNKNLRKEFVRSLWFFLFIVIPLLFVAGIIEGILVALVS